MSRTLDRGMGMVYRDNPILLEIMYWAERDISDFFGVHKLACAFSSADIP
jgi:hypothetical protein